MMATTRTTAAMGNGVADNPAAVGCFSGRKKRDSPHKRTSFRVGGGQKKEIGEEGEFGRGAPRKYAVPNGSFLCYHIKFLGLRYLALSISLAVSSYHIYNLRVGVHRPDSTTVRHAAEQLLSVGPFGQSASLSPLMQSSFL